MENIELFSSRICPFAHRCRLALLEKDLPFEVVEIDLRNKPAWYRKINPNEAVPALRQGDFVLWESLIINEYINELAAEPALLPDTVQRRAEARLWIDFAGTRFVPLFYRLLKEQEEDKRSTTQEKLLNVLRQLDEQLRGRRSGGPFWFGSRVGLADIALYPWFERWPVLEYYRGLPIPEEMKALSAWVEAMGAREAVQKAGMSAEFYIAAYAGYAMRS
jgi:glutathione S-transferase